MEVSLGWFIVDATLKKIFLDLGKVLAGIQVPPSDYSAFDSFLKQELDYSYVEETDNPVYRRYLRG